MGYFDRAGKSGALAPVPRGTLIRRCVREKRGAEPAAWFDDAIWNVTEYFAATKGPPFPAAIALEFLGRLLHNTEPIQAARAFPASHPHPNLWGTAGFALSSPLSRFPAHSDILQRRVTAHFFKIKARIIILHSRAVL